MNRIMMILSLSLMAVFTVCAQEDTATGEVNTGAGDFVVICPIDGMVDRGLGILVERAVRDSAKAKALILVVDTPGGLVDVAVKIAESLMSAPCPTIAYVKGGMGATSAGALISLACEDIVMAPGSSIGTAAPIIMTPQGTSPTSEKEVSFMRAKMRAIANKNGHNADIAQAMVDKDIELRAVEEDGKLRVYASNLKAYSSEPSAPSIKEIIDSVLEAIDGKKISVEESSMQDSEEETDVVLEEGSRIVCHSGKLLTLDPEEAKEYGLIKYTANSLNQVMGLFELHEAKRVEVSPSWSEILFRWLTNPTVSSILLMLGLGCLYFEIRTPGFGAPGIISLVAFALFFGAYAVLGMAEWLDLALVIIGFVLIMMEIFVIPGFGITGVAGILCLIIGFYLSMTDFVFTLPHYSWEFDKMVSVGYTVSLSGVMFILLIAALWKIVPHTPIRGMLVLSSAEGVDAGYVVQTVEECETAIGLKGVTTSMLRPAGQGRFADKTYRIVSRGEYLEKGTPVVIIQVDGNRYVVDKIEEI